METFLSLLMACSVMTSLTTEAVKKLLDEKGKKYSCNVIASVLAVLFAVGISAAYIVMTDMALTPKIAIYVVALVLLSFLCATLGYDKVVQTIAQINKSKG